MQYQTATISDIPQLGTLRWQFRKEDDSMPDESVAFYQRAGFSLDEVKFEYEVRPYED